MLKTIGRTFAPWITACVLASTAVVTGCSSLPEAASLPDDVVISVVSLPACDPLPDPVRVELSIANRGEGTFRVYIDSTRGRPYDLHWLAYSVASDGPSGAIAAWELGPGDHGPMPPLTLSIGPGDATTVVAHLYNPAQADKSSRYRIRIRDLEEQRHLSEPFPICLP